MTEGGLHTRAAFCRRRGTESQTKDGGAQVDHFSRTRYLRGSVSSATRKPWRKSRFGSRSCLCDNESAAWRSSLLEHSKCGKNRRALITVSYICSLCILFLNAFPMHLLARLVTKAAVVSLTAAQDVSSQALAAEKTTHGSRRWPIALRLAIYCRLQQWPAAPYPMAVTSVY